MSEHGSAVFESRHPAISGPLVSKALAFGDFFVPWSLLGHYNLKNQSPEMQDRARDHPVSSLNVEDFVIFQEHYRRIVFFPIG